MPHLGFRHKKQTEKESAKLLKLRDWNQAQEEVRRWDVEGLRPVQTARVTIEEWQEKSIQEAESSNLSSETLRKYRHLFKQLQDFARNKGVRNIVDWTSPL